MEHYWFKKRNYGWGWQPATWQGWIVICLYTFALISAGYNANFFTNKSPQSLFSFFPEVVFYTIILLMITLSTGEKPSWQWGKKKI